MKMWMHEHPPRLPIDKQIIAEFEKANPDIKVDYEVIAASEYATKLLTAFASGAGPDLFNQFSGWSRNTTTRASWRRSTTRRSAMATRRRSPASIFSGFDGIRFAGKLLRRPHRGQQLRLLHQQRDVETRPGSIPNKDFPEDLGGNSGGRGETHQA